MSSPQLIWFRQDLRLSDQAAVYMAAKAGPVIPVFVLDEAAPGKWATIGASKWWLHHSLAALAESLEKRGCRLLLLKGDAVTCLTRLAAETGAETIHALEHFEPWARRQQMALAKTGLLKLYDGVTLHDLSAIRTQSGASFKVFTPFWRTLQTMMPPLPPAPVPKKMVMAENAPKDDMLASWKLLPARPDWAKDFHKHWTPGEAGAQSLLKKFAPKVHGYEAGRNSCAEDHTSCLSPHLHFGEISPAQIWDGVTAEAGSGAAPYLRQLGWRDFSLNLLLTSPDFADTNWRRDFDAFPWQPDDKLLHKWQRGQTGYPIVDAGMRQLWATGWMHNRVRMITASFLIKHLLQDWRRGEEWFWDTLVDADLANNAAGWQWTAGSGADAAPYFRIFAPVTQGERFDTAGDYVRRWVPELAKLPAKFIHAPWQAPPLLLAEAGVTLGKTYPLPMVDHAEARNRALAAFKTLSAA
jgi:deoxyribodipyrimidine photo-lyase